MTKVKILTNGGHVGKKFEDAIGKVFDAEIEGELAHVNIGDREVIRWAYIIGTECEIVEDEPAEPNYAAQASEYGICIATADGVVYDGRDV